MCGPLNPRRQYLYKNHGSFLRRAVVGLSERESPTWVFRTLFMNPTSTLSAAKAASLSKSTRKLSVSALRTAVSYLA